MNKIETIKNALKNLETEDKVTLLNDYFGACDYDEYVYRMDDFDEIMSGRTPTQVIERAFYGGAYTDGEPFNPNAEYFRFNGYGNLESLDDYEVGQLLSLYLGEIAEAIDDGLELPSFAADFFD